MAQAQVGIPGQQIIEPANWKKDWGWGRPMKSPPCLNNTNFNKYLLSVKKKIRLLGQTRGKLGLAEGLARTLQGDSVGQM